MSVRGKTQAQAAQATAVATVNPIRSRVHQPIRPLKPVTSTPMSTKGPATPVQRAQASVSLQRQLGNARVSAMKPEPAFKPMVSAVAPVVAAPRVTLAAVPPTRKPPDVQAKGAPITAVPASKVPSTPPSQLKTSAPSAPVVSDEANVSSASTSASASPRQDKTPRTETTVESGEAKSKGGLSKGEKGAQGGKQTEEAPTGAASEAAGGEGMPAVKLRMPEPPTEVSPATARRISGVQARAGGAATAHAALPSGASQVGDARQAVTEPDVEAKAKTQADLMAMLDEQPAPSQEIIELSERIREVIRNKRPPDKDALMKAEPEGEALNAGNQLNSTVDGETKRVQENYGSLNNPPPGPAPQEGQALPEQPAAAETPGIKATAATPDAVPPGHVSLDADAADSKKKVQDAGMETPAAQLVQSGPIAEARAAQGELDQAAKEDPAKVLARQQETLAKADGNMAALQQQALAALTASRSKTSKGVSSQQQGMVGSEEAMRAKASSDAKQIFDTTQQLVTTLLQPLASNAMDKWDAAKTILVSQFKADLAIVQQRVEERHSGASGFVVGLWDAVTGLPDWAEDAYSKAERNFGDGVIEKITEISVEVNTIIAVCELLIKNARRDIAKIFSELPGSLSAWAAQEQQKFDGQLDQLHNQAIAAKDAFTKDLKAQASQAVDEVRAEISELRKKAGGLIGRIADAVNRFLDDPVKFIIEGLLELLGIPPASFWAVVAKIKQVVKDIADDPLKFASNLLEGMAAGFNKFFENLGTHLIKGFISWLTSGLGDVGVQLPKDASLKSIITFFLQLMGITWPRIRKILAKHVGEKNVALLEKVYSLVSFLIEKGPEGIYEMIKEKLDPQSIVDQVIQLAVDFLVSAVVKAATARIILLFNPAGAILQALEAIYRVLKWIFQNAARIFSLVETVVNGIGNILAGNIGGFAEAVEKALGMLIAPVIAFIADYCGLGDLPGKIADKIKSFQEWILGLIEKALVWIIEKGKALLAAVGIGGKDKDKKKSKASEEDIGEKIEFQAESKTHHLWIEGHGGSLAVVVASYKETVKEMLNRLEKNASEEAKGKIKVARDLLAGTLTVAKAEESKIEKAKTDPENDQTAADVSKAEEKTVDAEGALVQAIKEVFEACHVGGTIVAMVGKQVVIRGVPNSDDKLTGEFVTPGVPEGYTEYQMPLKSSPKQTKKYYIRRNEKPAKEEERPQVHIDEGGILQLGPSNDSAEDADKLQVYKDLLKIAGLEHVIESPALKKYEADVDAYRRESRAKIVEKLVKGGRNALLNFMADSKQVPPSYNRLRGDIYDQWLTESGTRSYSRPGPIFRKKDYPKIEQDRQPDGSRGKRIYDAKGHGDRGPSGEEMAQYSDYLTIINDEKSGYTGIVYVIMDNEARDKWESKCPEAMFAP